MFVKTLLLVSLVTLAGCLSSSPRNQGLPVREPVYAKSRPTGTLDVTQGDDLTTIELLKEKAQEIVRLKKRVRELEDALGQSDKLSKTEQERAQGQAEQVQRLRTLLSKMTVDHSRLNDQVISLEIEKLRLERKILNMKLANLATEGK